MCWQALDTHEKNDRVSTLQMSREDRHIYLLASPQTTSSLLPGNGHYPILMLVPSGLPPASSPSGGCLSNLKRYLPRIMQLPDDAQSSGILCCFLFHITWRTLWTRCHSPATLRKMENKVSLELNGLKVEICKVTLCSQVSWLSQNTWDN